MRVIISAGGTGGHIYPALAIVNKIKEMEPNSEFLYIGTHNRMEKDIVPNRGIPFKSIEMYGFNKKHPLKNFKTIKCLFKASRDVKKIIKGFNPDVVIGVGGYVTVPVLREAKKLGYKTFLHEQNSLPGKSNKYLIKYCDLIGVSFSSSSELLPKEKTILTGNPASSDALKKAPANKADLGLTPYKKLVLIVMGSLGAGRVSSYLKNELNKFAGSDYEVLFITGKSSYDDVVKNKYPKNVKIIPFYEGLPSLMKKCDLMVTRAGASTLSEIIALKVPSIIIPSPFVANNHQYINALDIVKKDAGTMIEEKDLKEGVLFKTVDNLIKDDQRLKEMRENLKSLYIDDSAGIIYKNLRKLIDESNR